MTFTKKALLTTFGAIGILGATTLFLQREEENFEISNAKRVTHPNGLKIKVPQEFLAKPIKSGFVVEPKENQLRNPVVIEVTLVGNKVLQQGISFSTKQIAGKVILYSLAKNDGGSGGETYTLKAFEATKNGAIKYEQAIQSELSEPDFDLLWDIVANTKLNS